MVGRLQRAELVGELVTLSEIGVVANLSDSQLLDRFLLLQGESAELAFEALVSRHGPMVLNVCTSILRDFHDAQDAFQATFLVLASRAGSIRQRRSLASWLLGAARHVALRLKANAGRRRLHERQAAEARSVQVENPTELWPELHEEIDRLPGKYRDPVILCYLQGLTTEAAALRLGCPHGTILSRLSRARDRLRGRLVRRGLVPPTDLRVDGHSRATAGLTIPAGLLDATVRASLRFAEQPGTAAALSSTTAVALARGVIYAMLIMKLKIVCVAAVACILAVGSIQTFAQQFGGSGAPSKVAAARARSSEPPNALVGAMDRIQADLDRSVHLNAKLQTELDALRAEVNKLRARQVAASFKAVPRETKSELSSPTEDDQQGTYQRTGDWILAASTHGDKLVAYDSRTGEKRSLSLGHPSADPHAIWMQGQRFVVCRLGRHLCAFSVPAKRWDVVEVPEACQATPVLGSSSATLRWRDHIYIYSLETGVWTHIELDAITPTKDARKDDSQPKE